MDTLPTGVSFVSVSTGEAGGTWYGSANGNTVTFTYSGAYAPDATDTFYVQVRLDPAYTGDGSDLTNVATVSSDTERPDGQPDAPSSEAVGVEGGVGNPESLLQLSKRVHPADGQDTVVPGGQAEITFELENRGPSVATGLSITDELPEGLAFHSGAACSGEPGRWRDGPAAG